MGSFTETAEHWGDLGRKLRLAPRWVVWYAETDRLKLRPEISVCPLGIGYWGGKCMVGGKRLLAGILSAVAASGILIGGYALAARSPLGDINGHWAEEHMRRWAEYGIVQGNRWGRFRPDKAVTRGEFATILTRLLGLHSVGENIYADLEGDEWYAQAILLCTGAGIMEGVARDGAVYCDAKQPLTRQEAIVMFARTMGVTEDSDVDLSQFSDQNSVSDWAAGYVSAMVEMDLIHGMGEDTIAGDLDMSRGSVMAMLDKSIEHYVTQPGQVEAAEDNRFVVVNLAGSQEDEATLSITGRSAQVVVATGSQDLNMELKGMHTDGLKVSGNATVHLGEDVQTQQLWVDEQATVYLYQRAAADSVSVWDQGSVIVSGRVGRMMVGTRSGVSIQAGANVDYMEVNTAAQVKNQGSIQTFCANDAVQVDNQGQIGQVKVTADGVGIHGNWAEKVYIDKAVTKLPNNNGVVILPTAETSEETPADTTPSPSEDGNQTAGDTTQPSEDGNQSAGDSTPPSQGGGQTSGNDQTVTEPPAIPQRFAVGLRAFDSHNLGVTVSKDTTVGQAIEMIVQQVEQRAEGFAVVVGGMPETYPQQVQAVGSFYSSAAQGMHQAAGALSASQSAAMSQIIQAINPGVLFDSTTSVVTIRDNIWSTAQAIRVLMDGSSTKAQVNAFLGGLHQCGVSLWGDSNTVGDLLANPQWTLEQLYIHNNYEDFAFTMTVPGAPDLGTITLAVSGQ